MSKYGWMLGFRSFKESSKRAANIHFGRYISTRIKAYNWSSFQLAITRNPIKVTSSGLAPSAKTWCHTPRSFIQSWARTYAFDCGNTTSNSCKAEYTIYWFKWELCSWGFGSFKGAPEGVRRSWRQCKSRPTLSDPSGKPELWERSSLKMSLISRGRCPHTRY